MTVSALFIWAATPRLQQNTIARNQGEDGSAVYVTSNSTEPFSTLTITNY